MKISGYHYPSERTVLNSQKAIIPRTTEKVSIAKTVKCGRNYHYKRHSGPDDQETQYPDMGKPQRGEFSGSRRHHLHIIT